MEKMDMRTPDFVDGNIVRIAELFPNCVTESAEGGVKAIDFDLLRQELSDNIVEGPQERYRLDWPGKREALITANTPITKTLRPCREESVDFDTTENLFIEGDNLDALKLLQETYLGKIKMIYIDPPYNTGKDFVYSDNFTAEKDEYLEDSGQKDAEGGRLIANPESNGRFHSDWLSMMYPRLKLARNLLSDDGVIFISIDDNEVHNVTKLCDEVFGEQNFISSSVVLSNPRGRQSDTFIATVHDSLIIYGKNVTSTLINGMPLNEDQKAAFNLKDEDGEHYRLLGLRQRGAASKRTDRPDMYFPIYVCPENQSISIEKVVGWHEVFPRKSDGTDGRWMWGKDKCKKDIGLLVGKLIERRNEYDIFVKDYLNRQGQERTRKYKSIWDSKAYNNQAGTQEVKAIFEADVMSFPKSKQLLCDICNMGLSENDFVLDFFAGSATTAHAVMDLNKEDGGNRKFIMIQLPEACDEKSEAYKAGYETIAEISKERIRRAGAKIKKELVEKLAKEQAENPLLSQSDGQNKSADDLDIGFRVLKVDTGNMEDVYYRPDEVKQDQIELFTDNIKADRMAEDLLFQVLLDWGVDLTLPVTKETISGQEVFFVDENALAACFADDGEITEDFCKELAQKEPLRVVFRDSGFKDDSVRINVEQIFKLMSPHTEVKTL